MFLKDCILACWAYAKKIETSQSSNLHFVMVFILRADMLRGGGMEKWKKVHIHKILSRAWTFFHFSPVPNKTCHLEQISRSGAEVYAVRGLLCA